MSDKRANTHSIVPGKVKGVFARLVFKGKDRIRLPLPAGVSVTGQDEVVLDPGDCLDIPESGIQLTTDAISGAGLADVFQLVNYMLIERGTSVYAIFLPTTDTPPFVIRTTADKPEKLEALKPVMAKLAEILECKAEDSGYILDVFSDILPRLASTSTGN